MKRISMVLVMLGVIAAAGVSAQDPARMLREAINKETVDGDCPGAIDLYKKVAAGSDRALAAQALLRMADCHRNMGNAEATKIYQQIVSAYGAQPEAAQARQRLSAMGLAGAPRSNKASRVAWTAQSPDQFPIAISSDGQRIVSTAADFSGLVLHELGTGVTRQLLRAPSGEMPGFSASFSRDGKQLAVTWFLNHGERAQLRVFNVDGPATQAGRVLISNVDNAYIQPFNWTSDGEWLAAAVDQPDRSSQLVLVSARTGALKVIKTFEPSKGVSNVAISPDDRYIAFDQQDDSGGSDVFIVGMDGGGLNAVVDHRAKDELIGWTADGTRLVLTSDRGGSQELMVLPVRDGRATGQAQSLQVDFDRAFSLGLTSTGSLYYTKRGGQPVSDVRIATLDARTGQLTSPMTDLVKEYLTGSVRAPDFSPDNKSIAYVIAPAGEVPAPAGLTLAIRSLETGSVRQLQTKQRTIQWLRWSPTGSALVAFGMGDSGLGLWRIDATSGTATLVAKQDGKTTISFVRWSGDGQKIAYRRQLRGSTEIWLHEYDVMTGTDRELFHIAAGSAVADLHISPDWRTIYYRRAIADGSTAPFQASAFVARDIATGTERELIRRNLGGMNVSPDGRYIVTGSNDQATRTRSLIVIPVDGGPVKELMRIDLPTAFVDRTSTVSPLVVYKQPAGSDVVIASKDFGTGSTVERSEYWWVPIDGRPATLLDLGSISDLRISPDGRRIAIMPTQPQPQLPPVEIHVLERFLPGK